MVGFDRPVGPPVDTKELEYISALHQSGALLRSNGSIRDEDIKAYLRSRFGIEVTLAEVRNTILQGLGGSDGEGEVIDLMELTAIILIPLLLKAAVVVKTDQTDDDDDDDQPLPPGVVPPPPHLLETTLAILLHDVMGGYIPNKDKDNHHHVLTPDFVRNILLVYGEADMAQDDALIQEMIQAAAPTNNNNNGTVLDVSAWADALTQDVQLYDIANETRVSTSLQDVFHNPNKNNTKHVVDDDEEVLDKMGAPAARQEDTLVHIYTAPAIDIQAGTYRSKALMVCLWGCVLFGLFPTAITISTTSVTGECPAIDEGQGWGENTGALICRLWTSIVTWLAVFALLSFGGVFTVGLGSLGNYVGHTRWYLPLIGAACALVFGFSASGEQSTQNDLPYFRYIYILSKIFSVMVAYFHMCNFVAIVYHSTDFEKTTWGRRLGLAPLGREVHVKKAGAHKINHLVENAMTLMKRPVGVSSVLKTYFGHGLSAFTASSATIVQEYAGGFFWTWQRVRDQSIFEKEGIWYSTRLVASNFTQLSVSLFILLLGMHVIQEVRDNFGIEKAQTQISRTLDNVIDSSISEFQASDVASELTTVFTSYLATSGTSGLLGVDCTNASTGASYLIEDFCDEDVVTGYFNCSSVEASKDSLCLLIQNPDLGEFDPATVNQLLEASDFNTTYMRELVQTQMENVINDAVNSMYPEEEYMVIVPIYVAVVVAVLAAFRLSMLYLPGLTTTILELRSGVIPSLTSSSFQKYRVAPDTVTMLTGSLFWGCLVSSILLGLLIGFFAFLFLWQGSMYTMLRLFAGLLGVACILIIKVLTFYFCCRRGIYKGLYRIKPAASNISLLALEWANFVFTVAFILVRMFKIVLIAVAGIGQIDRRLLADGVGQIGDLEFDPYPTMHVRDLVAHEAHRHPYIEILGTMYLMKLRYSRSFGSRAGSAWRLIFIYALLPWMHQYRIVEESAQQDGPLADSLATTEGDNVEVHADDKVVLSTTSAAPRRLPSLEPSALSDAANLEEENKKLKKKIKKLSQQLRELQSASPAE